MVYVLRVHTQCSTSHSYCHTKSSWERDFSISHSWTPKTQTRMHFWDKNVGAGLDPNCLALKFRYCWNIVLETLHLENTSRFFFLPQSQLIFMITVLNSYPPKSVFFFFFHNVCTCMSGVKSHIIRMFKPSRLAFAILKIINNMTVRITSQPIIECILPNNINGRS